MPDISMCTNSTCSDRAKCYRYMAIPNPSRQTYANFQGTGCEYFWDVKKATSPVYLTLQRKEQSC